MMRRNHSRREQAHSQHTHRWLVSYADYMTIMFALFVVMYAVAIKKEDTFKVLSDSLEHIFVKSARQQQAEDTGIAGTGVLTDRTTPEPEVLYGESIQKEEKGPELLDGQSKLSEPAERYLGKPLDSMLEKLQAALVDEIRSGQASLELNQDWLTIELSSALLFPSGSALATDKAKQVVEYVYGIIAPIDNYIRVRGYTDDQYIHNEIFTSNWQLSVARAGVVLEELQRLGINPARMAIEGYGQYAPFADNDTEAGRAENRKVVIALSKYGLPPAREQIEEKPADEQQATEKTPERALPSGDGQIKVIQLPHGGIRITTREQKSVEQE